MIKIEICSLTQEKSGLQPRIHGDFLFWQMQHKDIRCQLSHDKKYLFFDDEQEFEKFKLHWTKPFTRLY